MSRIGLFEAIGPWMVGPSSSHTAGACSIALTGRRLFGRDPQELDITLYGSFAQTGRGHGTDLALLGGAMGMEPWDERIRDSRAIAAARGIRFSIRTDPDTATDHPNTADIVFTDEHGSLSVRGESVGGGKICIRRLDGVDVRFTGEFPTLIVAHRDEPGALHFMTGVLENYDLNIASLRCYRESRGGRAYAVIESDGRIDEQVLADMREGTMITNTLLLQV